MSQTEHTQQDRTLALIGIYQASQGVYELATQGKTNEHAFTTALNSLFCESPNNTLEVFGGDIANIQQGVETLLAQMSSQQAVQNRNIEITRYVLNLMILAKKTLQDGAVLNKVFGVLETARAQQEQFGKQHENVMATIARAYSENISPISPKIMVKGKDGHLTNPKTANKIRSLLLAGLRSALLWYQVGGSRWGLIWSRKKYLQTAQALYRPNSNENTTPFTSQQNQDTPESGSANDNTENKPK